MLHIREFSNYDATIMIVPASRRRLVQRFHRACAAYYNDNSVYRRLLWWNVL